MFEDTGEPVYNLKNETDFVANEDCWNDNGVYTAVID
jgi:hypothetical protein